MYEIIKETEQIEDKKDTKCDKQKKTIYRKNNKMNTISTMIK
jgi:uncharacterized protein Yka (UPF0111/DUF47 family)